MPKKSSVILTPPTASKKKRINSKNKGGVFERQVAKDLSLWYSNNRSTEIFYRTASSGGRGTQRYKRGQTVVNSAGDLSFLDSEGEQFLKCCCVEIKAGYPAASLNKLFSSSKPELVSFFSQAHESAIQSNSPFWTVIHKQDRQSVMLYCNASLLIAYRDACCHYRDVPITTPGFDFAYFPFPMILVSVKIAETDTLVAGMRFVDFLTLDPEFFRPQHICPT